MSEIVLTKADHQRGRNLLWLILAAVAATALAVLAIVTERASTAPASMSEPMFPDLAQQLGNAASIRIEGPAAIVTVNKDAAGRWVVADRSNYPANADGVRAIANSLAQLTLIERRTADPARHAALDLTTGDGGNGHAITIQAADGSTIAALVAGKVQTQAVGTTLGTLYVRRAGEDQTWLARGGFAFPASVGATLDKTLFAIAPERIKSVTFAPNGKKPYAIARETPDAKSYTLDTIPDGKEANEAALSGPAGALASPTFEDVMKADAIKTEGASTATYRTFDGLVMKVTLASNGAGDTYALFEASVDDKQAAAAPAPAEGKTKPDAAADAAAINARTGGWAYKLASYVASTILPSLDTLVQNKAPAGPPADEAEPEGEPAPAPQPGPPPPVPPQ
ncbi:MAG: DUF4340 domain-containing protein [Alphaproteobacteria bacterium]|nr:DUF4340 domain-containing protein [Alphaproteobacteria bacterium]